MKDVISALDRNEEITILYHGKVKAIMKPVSNQSENMRVQEHPLFGIDKNETSVAEVTNNLRRERYK